MIAQVFKIFILIFALAFAISAEAQKTNDRNAKIRDIIAKSTIVISDSLVSNADKMEVHMTGKATTKSWKFNFGEYSVVSVDKEKSKTKTKENFFNTKTESKSTRKFSFQLNNSAQNSASVMAEQNQVTKTQKNMVLGVIHAGDNEWVESDNLMAWITIDDDTSETWMLYIGNTGVLKTEDNYAAFLSNGQRNIILTPVNSNYDFTNKLGLPSRGYEFFENGQSLCALQYFGLELGEPTDLVWMDRRLDAKMKLVLAATMTVIFRKSND